MVTISDGQIYLRLTLSLVLGGLIGLERQLHRRTAGLRTHIMVCLGSCLIMLTSLYVFDIYINKVPLDPVRIASNIVTGVGFLGAGAIIRDSGGIKGLTTASSLWLVAGIGIAIGCGFYHAAIFSSVLGLVTLFFLRYTDHSISRLVKKYEKEGGEE